jgi:hypothetical protein
MQRFIKMAGVVAVGFAVLSTAEAKSGGNHSSGVSHNSSSSKMGTSQSSNNSFRSSNMNSSKPQKSFTQNSMKHNSKYDSSKSFQGKKFSHGFCFDKSYCNWSYSCFSPSYGCNTYYCPTSCCWYYYCQPYACYYPVTYCPTGSYCCETPVCEPVSDTFSETVGQSTTTIHKVSGNPNLAVTKTPTQPPVKPNGPPQGP